jgi:phage repressor protein C with HTH and peptisase S24 domain
MKWYPVPLSAGGGSISPYEAPGADLNMEELASELLGIPIAAIRIFRIRGDSMLPTFVDGDLVVIDSRSTFPDDNGIYAFSWNGETYAKRAQWLEANRLLWKSDNEDNHHAAFEVAGEELPTMSIFGRVVWVWKPV